MLFFYLGGFIFPTNRNSRDCENIGEQFKRNEKPRTMLRTTNRSAMARIFTMAPKPQRLFRQAFAEAKITAFFPRNAPRNPAIPATITSPAGVSHFGGARSLHLPAACLKQMSAVA